MMKRVDKFVSFLRKKYGKRTGAVHKRRRSPFQVLISCIISQRTRDENTDVVSKRLFKVARTPKAILKLSNSKLEKLIKSSGFFRQKSKMIKNASKFLLEKYKGKVPNTREKLMEVPGIGFKCSAVILSYCFNGKIIAVDVNVERISKRIGFADEKDDVEVVREKLEKLISPKKRHHTHLEMIHFGKEICIPRTPRCSICELKSICRYNK